MFNQIDLRIKLSVQNECELDLQLHLFSVCPKLLSNLEAIQMRDNNSISCNIMTKHNQAAFKSSKIIALRTLQYDYYEKWDLRDGNTESVGEV